MTNSLERLYYKPPSSIPFRYISFSSVRALGYSLSSVFYFRHLQRESLPSLYSAGVHFIYRRKAQSAPLLYTLELRPGRWNSSDTPKTDLFAQSLETNTKLVFFFFYVKKFHIQTHTESFSSRPVCHWEVLVIDVVSQLHCASCGEETTYGHKEITSAVLFSG